METGDALGWLALGSLLLLALYGFLAGRSTEDPEDSAETQERRLEQEEDTEDRGPI